MRARGALWLVSLLAIGGLTAAGVSLLNRTLRTPMIDPEHPHRLRIMTWNIGKLHLPWDSRAADGDLQHVAEVIREANPHLVALQELRDPRQLGRLVTALGPGWRGKLPEDWYDRRAALVVRLPAEFAQLRTSTGRIAQGATLRLPSGLVLAIASVHLDAFDTRRRLLQAQEVVAGLHRLGSEHLVLAGDLNFDPAVAAQGSIDQDLYRFLASEFVDAARDAGATTLISRRLDYVLYHSTEVLRASSRVLRDKRIRVMDHDPLVVELWLTGHP